MSDDAVSFASQAEWEAWLEANHATVPGVWMKVAKKGAGLASVTIDEALETALCFGWIDGQRKALDERFFLQRYTPRTRRSKWSRINRGKAELLIASGRMRPAGLAAVEAARADGRWDAAYEPQSSAKIPSDLKRELEANPRTAAFFETLDSRNRYAIIYRLNDAKRPETRARRLAEFVEMLREGRMPLG
jgi:uncharacterized protein YdeI (YjbR/CyaY-like superfamily)